MRRSMLLCALMVVVVAALPARAEDKAPDVTGLWWTSYGMVDLKKTKDGLRGTYGAGGQYAMEGRLEGRALKVTLREDGPAEGECTFEVDETGSVMRGAYKWPNGNQGEWTAVRQDPKAADGPTASFSGTWLTARGACEFVQTGDKVEGKYAFGGPVAVDGTVKGRRMSLRWKGPTFAGTGWIELSKDKKSWSGVTQRNGSDGFATFFGRPLAGHPRKPKPKAGAIVDGLTANMLTYHVRMPDGWAAGKPVPCVLILHGSNMTAKSYVHTLASAWPDLAKRFAILGIDGETYVESSKPDAPMFNYTYVNFVGKSTYKGFPGTDRESPALIAEAVDELRRELGLGKVLVGGHSQGGFLTYSLAMNYPDRFAGAFPISCGLIFQAEPKAYEDAALRSAQRRLPLAVVHGTNDGVVDFSMGRYAHQAFEADAWSALRLFASDTAAHMFAMLPVRDAILWLDALSGDDPEALAAFGEAQAAAEAWRDVAAVVLRAKALAKGKPSARVAALEGRLEVAAKGSVAELAAAIAKNADRSWVDGFLEFRAKFEFAEGSKPAMDAYAALRAKHQPEADARQQAGRQAMQNGDEAAGWAAYQEILDRFYASSWYPQVKRWIAERDAKK